MGSSRDRFVALAEARTTKTLKMIRLLGNLSNKSNYTYSDKDVGQIFSTLERELKNARRRFGNVDWEGKDFKFTLTDRTGK